MKKVLLENALSHLFILLSACAVDNANSEWNHRVVVRTPFFEDQCRVDVLPNPETFRKQHFLFIGDSVTRYSYLNFAYYLDNAEFPPHVQDEARPSLSNEHTWPGWKDFYLQTTATFNGKERCDCYRQETGYNPSKIYENRYYNKSSAQITSTYLQLFGYHDMAIRNPIGAHSAQNLSRTYGWSSPDRSWLVRHDASSRCSALATCNNCNSEQRSVAENCDKRTKELFCAIARLGGINRTNKCDSHLAHNDIRNTVR